MAGKRAEKRKSAKDSRIIVIVLLTICVLTGVVYADTFYGNGDIKAIVTGERRQEKEEKKKNNKMEIPSGSKPEAQLFGEEFLLCSRDGVRYYSAMNTMSWSDTFTMSAPTLIREGEYMAVGDVGGKMLHVYNRQGPLYKISAEGEILQFALNRQGWLSMVVHTEHSYQICIYNKKGKIVKKRVEENKGIYPLSSDISDDSESFAVSYLDTTDIKPVGRVLMFYIDAEKSKKHTDSIYAAVEKKDELISVVSFKEGDLLTVLSDRGLYGIRPDGSEAWKYTLDNAAEQADFSQKEYTVLVLGDALPGKEGKTAGTVLWLDSRGRETASYCPAEEDTDISYLRAEPQGIVIGSGSRYWGVDNGGDERWQYRSETEGPDLLPMENINDVMLVTKEFVRIMDMSEEERKAEETERKKEKAEAKKKEAALAAEKERAKRAEEKRKTEEETDLEEKFQDAVKEEPAEKKPVKEEKKKDKGSTEKDPFKDEDAVKAKDGSGEK